MRQDRGVRKPPPVGFSRYYFTTCQDEHNELFSESQAFYGFSADGIDTADRIVHFIRNLFPCQAVQIMLSENTIISIAF